MEYAIVINGIFGSYTLMWGPISIHGENEFDGEFIVFDGAPEYFDSSGDRPSGIYKSLHHHPFSVFKSQDECMEMVERMKKVCAEHSDAVNKLMDNQRCVLQRLAMGSSAEKVGA